MEEETILKFDARTEQLGRVIDYITNQIPQIFIVSEFTSEANTIIAAR